MADYKKGAKPEKPEKRPGKPWMWIFIVLMVILELFVYTTVRLESMQARREIAQAETENDNLVSRTTALMVEKERLNSPGRISQIAESKLDMGMPSSDHVIYINFDEL
mgnify:CR=1 FL=1